MNKKYTMKPKVASNKKLPKYNPGTPASKMDPSAMYGEIGDIAYGAGQVLNTGNAHDFGTQAGKVLGSTGKGLSIGANPALMAATGGLSAPIGAVLGAGYGVIDAANANSAQIKAENRQLAVNNMATNNSISTGVNAQYNLRNKVNDRVPGLKDGIPSFKSAYAGIPGMNGYSNFGKGKNRYDKGVAKFKSTEINPSVPNAMVAPEEVVKDGQTGELNQIPGQYNPNNPDTVSANLTDGSSVFSNRQSQVIPGGKKTPAQIMAKATAVQKRADRVLSPKEGDIKLSRIDILTAELNKRNIEKQSENLNKYNMLVNPQLKQGTAQSYANGTPSSGSKYNINYGNGENIDEQIRSYGLSSEDEAGLRGLIGITGMNGTGVAGYDLGQIRGFKKNTQPAAIQQVTTPAQSTILPTVNSTPITKQDISALNTNITNSSNSINRQASSVRAQNVQTSIDNQFNNNSGSEGLKSGSTGSYWQPGVPTGYGNTKMPQFNPSHSYNYTLGSSTIDGIDTSNKIGVSGGQSHTDSGLGSLGADLASLAPSAYNAWNATPEVVAPIYANYINPNQRYNIAPELQEATKQRQIARYNGAAIGGGNGQAYAADIYGKGVDQLGSLYGRAEAANAQYRSEYANRHNQAEGDSVNEQRRVADLNSRNRAAARNMTRSAIEGVSKYTQTKQLMNNQKRADLLNSNIFGLYNTAMTKEQRANLDKLLNQAIN